MTRDVLDPMVDFGHELRAAGISVGPAHIRSFCEAAVELPAEDLYWAGRTTLVARPEHIAVFDEVFRRFFGGEAPTGVGAPGDPAREVRAPRIRHNPDAAAELLIGTQAGSAGATELLREKSFSACTSEEWRQLVLLMQKSPQLLPRRRTRRYGPGRPGPHHVRRIVRQAAATGGEPIHLPRRRRRTRARPLVFLIDISGSMAEYSRALLLFGHAVLRTTKHAEAFTFGTRLTRVTPVLGGASIDGALKSSAAAVADWDGGTRIGEALRVFLEGHRLTADLRRSVVVICSDGFETGDPRLLAAQARRLQRSVHRVVWLNPLKQSPRYEPTAQGMHAALPFVDHFASGHSLASLEHVLEELSKAH